LIHAVDTRGLPTRFSWLTQLIPTHSSWSSLGLSTRRRIGWRATAAPWWLAS